jgi:hypothetical protein
MGLEDPRAIPNFTEEGSAHFWSKLEAWLTENNLEYIEVSLDEFWASPCLPSGPCGIVGKSPRGEYDHIVVGRIEHREEGGSLHRDLHFVHDTSPHHDGRYIDGKVKWVGFLVRKLQSAVNPDLDEAKLQAARAMKIIK